MRRFAKASPRPLPPSEPPPIFAQSALVVEGRRIEIDDVPALLAEPELAEPADQILAELGDRGIVLESPRSELVCEPELRPRLQPRAEVVPGAVVADALVRYGVQGGLERAQVPGACQLVALGIPEHEVAEAHLIDQEVGQPADQAARALADEGHAELVGEPAVLRIRGLEEDRDVGVRRAHVGREVDARVRILLASMRERDVRDQSHHVLVEAVEVGKRLLVVVAEEDLRARSEALDPVGSVHAVGQDHRGVLEQHGVDGRAGTTSSTGRCPR